MSKPDEKITNAELRQIIDSHEKGYGMCVPVNCDYLMAKELLAVREAQPVGSFHIRDQQVEATTDYVKDGEWPINNGELLVYAAPPAPAVPDEKAFRLEFEKWVADYAGNTAGFVAQFRDGDGYRIDSMWCKFWAAWNACRAAMLERQSVDHVDHVEQTLDMVPAGFRLVPIEMTDEIGEAIAAEANCCGGIALDIYNAALAAAPTPTKAGNDAQKK